MQTFFLAIFSRKSVKASSVLPSLHSAKPRHFFSHIPVFLILPVLKNWDIPDDQVVSSISLQVQGIK